MRDDTGPSAGSAAGYSGKRGSCLMDKSVLGSPPPGRGLPRMFLRYRERHDWYV